jgi:hypothetical protein
MSKIAYLANHFPCAVEPYVVDEILELRKRGVEVIPCSAWPTEPGSVPKHRLLALETVAVVEAKMGPAAARTLGVHVEISLFMGVHSTHRILW